MKSSFMKLNHVSTFSGKGQFEMLHRRAEIEKQHFRKNSALALTLPVNLNPRD